MLRPRTLSAAIAAVLLALLLTPCARAQYGWAQGKDPAHLYLLWGGVQVGTFSHIDGKYYPLTNGGYGPSCPCPVRSPVTNYGLDRSKLKGRERYASNGQEVTSAEAQRLLGSPEKLPDDRHRPFAVIVGTEAQCSAAQRWLDAAPYRDVLRVQCYRPDDAMVKDRDGRPMYGPGVTLVSAEGIVVGHSDTFDCAAELAEGLRRLGPDYDPSRAPPLAGGALGSLVGSLFVVALGCLGLLLLVGLGVYALVRRS